jgi:hypothetical protein
MPDDFEYKILAPFIQDGHLQTGELSNYMAVLERRQRSRELEASLQDAIHMHRWDITNNTDRILAILQHASRNTDALDYASAGLAARIAEESGDTILQQTIIDNWIAANELLIRSTAKRSRHLFHRLIEDMHPRIRAEFEKRRAEEYPVPTLPEAIKMLASDDLAEQALKALEKATTDQFELLLRTPDPRLLEATFSAHKKFFSSSPSNGESGSPSTRFQAACRNIITLDANSRLAAIIQREFAAIGLSERLKHPQP